MLRINRLLAITAAAALTTAALLGPMPARSQTSEAEPSAATKAQKWTQKQWSEMTEEWRKDRSKWDDCTKKANAQKLQGQEVWTYIYGCMKT